MDRGGLATVAGLMMLSGCALAPDGVLKRAELPSHDILATDSRLRIIAESQLGVFSTTGLVDPNRIFCVEPSPDVATTLASSLGVGISVLDYGAGSLSTQQVEGLVQLGERTAAIQLLRDKMYQTCLAYANGAISGTNYSLIMSKLDDTIVTLSLGDGAAGAFGRKLAGIGGKASATAEASLIGLPGEIRNIEDQSAKLAEANKKVDKAAKDLAEYKATQPVAGQEQAHKTKSEELERAHKEAQAERDALMELLRSSAKSSSQAAGEITKLEPGGGLSPRPDGHALRQMQADFLLTDVNRDLVSACLVELGLRGRFVEKDSLDAEMEEFVDLLGTYFARNPNAETAANYAAGIQRSRGTALAGFCYEQLPSLIQTASENLQDYRMKRTELEISVAAAEAHADNLDKTIRAMESFQVAINFCTASFPSDADRKNGCIDAVISLRD